MRVTGIKTGIGLPHNLGHSNAWRNFSINDSVAYQSRWYFCPKHNKKFVLRVEDCFVVQVFEDGREGFKKKAFYIDEECKNYILKPHNYKLNLKDPAQVLFENAIKVFFSRKEIKTITTISGRKEKVVREYSNSVQRQRVALLNPGIDYTPTSSKVKSYVRVGFKYLGGRKKVKYPIFEYK